MAATPIKPSIKQLAATRPLLVATLAGLLAACGGGEGSSNVATAAPEAQAQAVAPPAGTTRADAFRLLTQASFGPTDADLARAMSLGAAGWVDEQLAKPAQAVHLARYNADDAAWKQIVPGDPIGARSVISSFYELTTNCASAWPLPCPRSSWSRCKTCTTTRRRPSPPGTTC